MKRACPGSGAPSVAGMVPLRQDRCGAPRWAERPGLIVCKAALVSPNLRRGQGSALAVCAPAGPDALDQPPWRGASWGGPRRYLCAGRGLSLGEARYLRVGVETALPRADVLRLTALMPACAAAALLNPYGARLLAFSVKTAEIWAVALP